MKTNKNLINHMKSYTVFQWMLFIKRLENLSDTDFYKLEQDSLERFCLQNSNWYSIILDLAIRFSNSDDRIVKLNEIPNKLDYRKFISFYLNSKDNESNFRNDLKVSLHVSMSRYAHEQLRKYTPLRNDISRLLDLYEEKELLFKQFLGLSPKQMFYFVTIHNSHHNINSPFTFKIILDHLKGYDPKIKAKKLELFLSKFSISIKSYRMKCKELGYTKDVVKNMRLIDQYPIIDLGNERYFIPSINSLSEALTYRVFDTLCELQVNEKGFKRSFGITFENYTRRMTKFTHNEYFYECDNLIKEKNRDKAEYYLLKDDSVIVVESKLLPVNENIILNGQIKELEDEFIKTMDKALGQIESCFNKINAKNQYGIIVIHTHTLMLENYLDLIKKRLNYSFMDNIYILSIIDFEILIDNPFEKIVEYFEQPKDNNRQQLSLFFDYENRYLNSIYLDVFDKLEKELEERKNEK